MRFEILPEGRGCYFMDFDHYLYSTLTEADSRYLPLHCQAAFAIDSARQQVVAAVPGAIRRLALATGEYLHDNPISTNCPGSMAVSPDGSTLVVIGDACVRAFRLSGDGTIDSEIASGALEVEPRPGVPILFLDSRRVMFPLDILRTVEAKLAPGRAQRVFLVHEPDQQHRLMIFHMDSAALEPQDFTYSGWCNALSAVANSERVALAIGDAMCLYRYPESGRAELAFRASPEAGVLLYSYGTGTIAGQLTARRKDEGAVALGVSPETNRLAVSFRHGRVRLASLDPLQWLQSV